MTNNTCTNGDAHVCKNFYEDDSYEVCVDCGRIYEGDTSFINYTDRSTYKPVNNSNIDLKYRVTSFINSYIKNYNADVCNTLFDNLYFIINKSTYKGNNKKSISLLLIFNYYCVNSIYDDDLIKVVKAFPIELFTKSKKMYKKITENNLLDIEYNSEIYDIVYYTVYYGIQVELSNADIINCLHYYKDNNIFTKTQKCNANTVAITVLYKIATVTPVQKKQLESHISLPTLTKILKLI